MAPVVLPPLTDENRLEKQLERQMSCTAGFLQLFDRHQRMYAPKKLASSSGSTSPSEMSEHSAFPSSPESKTPNPSRPQTPSPLPFPVFDSWKLREAPRLSLDSRLLPRDPRPVPAAARADAAVEIDRRPTSVVARLMGLDSLPELRRSASESRVPRDPHRFVDESPFPKPAPDPIPVSRSKTPPPLPPTKKNFFDAHDFFPEVERRLRMQGIDEPAKDLEALKQFLEASQLKGLFHSPGGRRSSNTDNTPPIVVLKPGTKPPDKSSEPAKGIRNRRPVSPDPNPRNVQSSPPKPKPSRKRSPTTARSPRNQRSATDASPKEETRIRSPNRCDELLRSIDAAEQPSPVSVLDLTFLGEGSPPSRTAKPSITEWEESIPDFVGFDVTESYRRDFVYVYDIVRLSERQESPANVYQLVELWHGANDAAESAVLHRKVIFDEISAIVVRKQKVSYWEAFSKPGALSSGKQLVREVWLEATRTRDGVVCAAAAADDLSEVTRNAIRKDMAGADRGWAGTSAEMTDTVALRIERLVFEDLVAETIGDLADVAGGKRLIPWRRKLVF